MSKSEKVAAIAASPFTVDLPAIPPDVRLITLENGLSLIIREDHSAPVVSAQGWCMAGSIHEGRWLGAGLSHVLEHMLFKGTSTRPGSRIDQEVQEAGGYMNAYTSFDRTVYWINVPNTGARVAIDILSDILQNATIPADELEKEKQVILREMDMNQDDPHQRSGRRLFEVAYTRSPYRFTVIGYPEIFNQVTRDDINAFYREKYVPNNLFLVVVGDVKAAEVEAQVRECFKNSKPRPLPPEILPPEPRQIAPREITETAPIELAHLHFCWHIPELRHPDIPMIEVLATLLGGGRSSRLYRRIREEKGLVASIDAWTYSPGNPGLFGISAVIEPPKFEAAREAILRELEEIQNTPVTTEEIVKVIKQFTAGTLSSRKTMQGQAQDLGFGWLAANDLNFSARYLETVKRASPAELQRVASTYFTLENRTAYALVPPGTAKPTASAVVTTAENAVRKVQLENGLCLLLKEDHRLPFVELRAVLRGGVLAESAQISGSTLMLSKLLLQGTSTRSAEEIANSIESVGGHIDAFAGNNSIGVSTEVLSSDFDLGLDLLADVLLNPVLPIPAFEREREIQLAGIRSQRDEILASAFRLMRRTLYGPAGYGLQAIGDESSVQALTLDHLRTLHQQLVVPNNCVLSIFGDIQPEKVQNLVQSRMGHWARGLDPARAVAPPQLESSKHVQDTRDKKQAVVVIGFPGASMFDPDRYPLELIQEACSDLGSRLFMRIRDRLGLAYYVGAQNLPGLIPGFFAFYAGTMPEKVDEVRAEMLREAELLRAEGLTSEELKRSKAKVLGQKKIARQDLGSLATTCALDELYGLGFGYSEAEDAQLEAITIEQTREAARKYLREDRCVVAVIRPQA